MGETRNWTVSRQLPCAHDRDIAAIREASALPAVLVPRRGFAQDDAKTPYRTRSDADISQTTLRCDLMPRADYGPVIHCASISGLDLLQGKMEKFAHFLGDQLLRNAFRRKVFRYFAQGTFTALALQIRGDELIRIGSGSISLQTELLRNPIAQHLVAPRRRLESQLFIVHEFRFKTLLAFVKSRHDLGPDCIDRARLEGGGRCQTCVDGFVAIKQRYCAIELVARRSLRDGFLHLLDLRPEAGKVEVFDG